MKLHYTEKGKGTIVLVFLHYFGGAASSWDAVISRLQNDYRCLAVDMPGFGKSPSPKKTIKVEENAKEVTEWIQSLHLTNYVLIGHSMGGKIAIQIATQKPEGLLALALIAPSPPTPEPMKEGEREAMIAAFNKENAVKEMLQKAISSDISDEAFQKEVNNNLSVSQVAWLSWPQTGSKEDISPKMKELTVPVSILCGEKDEKFTEAFLKEEFSKYFPSFSIKEIKGVGHLLPVEAPEEVAMEIKKTLHS